MSINNKIRRLKESNYLTLPTNRARFENPFLLKSTTEAVNNWSVDINKSVVGQQPPTMEDATPEDLDLPFNPQGVTAMGSKISDEDLAIIIQSDVYTKADRRLKLTGYAYRGDLSDDKTSVYVGPNRVLVGFRGTATPSDWLADFYLGNRAMGEFVDNLFGTEKWDDEEFPRPGYETYKERELANDKLIKNLRAKYPSKKIIISGHSYGGSQVKQVLADNPDDNNLVGHSFNSWLDPKFKEDPRETNRNTLGDIVSSITSIFQKKKPISDIDVKASSKALEAVGKRVGLGAGKAVVRKAIQDRLKAHVSREWDKRFDTWVESGLENAYMIAKYEYPENPNDTLEALEHFENDLGEGYTQEELQEYFDRYRYDEAKIATAELERGNWTTQLLRGGLSTLDRYDPLLTGIGNLVLAKDLVKVVHSADNFRPSVEARKYLLPKQFEKEIKRVERRKRQQQRFREMEKSLESSDISYIY